MELKELLQVKEDYQVPDKLMSVLLDDAKRPELFKHFEKEDLKRDFLREYFETNQADRKNFMQDFTPDCVGEIVRGIIGNTDSVLDVCSGTGGLSTKAWADNPNAEFRCEEYSEAALPFTLFNMAIRNVNGHVVHENVLTREIKAIYKLSKGEKYSSIELELIDEEQPVSVAVTNPPYSQKWENINEYKDDVRFKEYGLPPKSKADFAFLLHAYSKIKEHGILVAILPHGVLFRGAAEGSIRQRLVETGAIETIIGLPENLFTNTSIPTVLLIMRRDRANKDIYFIDASKRFVKKKNINVYQSVCAAYPKFAHKYIAGMNFQIETLNHLKICLHDLQTQQEMANDFMRMQATMEGEQKLLEKFEDIKKAMLELMFP